MEAKLGGMTHRQPVSKQSVAIFECESRVFTLAEVVDAAHFRGELEPLRQDLLRLLACDERAAELDLEMDESAVQEMSDAFRQDHDLITAEEAEQWLEKRGLTMEDFSDHFARRYWARTLGETVDLDWEQYVSASVERRDLLTTELLFSGEADRLAARLAWRAAQGIEDAGEPGLEAMDAERERFFTRAAIDPPTLAEWLAQLGRDERWFGEMLRMEAVHRRRCDALLSAARRHRAMENLRLPLTRFHLETIELDSRDAAFEALLCMREDGLSLTDVAMEGRYPLRRLEIVLEDISEALRQKFLSAASGQILGPIERGEEFQLCRVLEKSEPDLADAKVCNRVERQIFERDFAELAAKHIRWLINASPLL